MKADMITKKKQLENRGSIWIIEKGKERRINIEVGREKKVDGGRSNSSLKENM